MKESYYGVFGFFVALLILIFSIWQTSFSRVVILISALLMIVISILEILIPNNLTDIPLDYKEDETVVDVSDNKKSSKFIKELENKKIKKEVV